MTPVEILNFILEKEKLNPSKLSKVLGYERPQAIYDIRKGKAKSLSGDFVKRVVTAFPNSGYTFEFLLSGSKGSLEGKCSQEEKKNGILSIDAIGERVKKLIEYKKCSVNSFAKVIGIRQNTLHQQLTGDRRVSMEVIYSIIISYSDIDANWLITGKGNMLKEDKASSDNGGDVKEEVEALKKEIKRLIEVNEDYETILKNRDKFEEGLANDIIALKEKISLLKGENKILRELAGLKFNKDEVTPEEDERKGA